MRLDSGGIAHMRMRAADVRAYMKIHIGRNVHSWSAGDGLARLAYHRLVDSRINITPASPAVYVATIATKTLRNGFIVWCDSKTSAPLYMLSRTFPVMHK